MNGINDMHPDALNDTTEQNRLTSEDTRLLHAPSLLAGQGAEELVSAQSASDSDVLMEPEDLTVIQAAPQLVVKPPVKPPVKVTGPVEPPVKPPAKVTDPVKPPVKPPVKVTDPVKPPVKPKVKPATTPLVEQKVPPVPEAPSRLDKLLAIINTATGVLQLIHPLDSVFNPDGTVSYPDGSIAAADGQSVTRTDGTVQNLDGTTAHANGAVEHPSGDVQHKDGTWVMADGSIKYPDGRWKLPDGMITDAEGNVIGTVGPDAAL